MITRNSRLLVGLVALLGTCFASANASLVSIKSTLNQTTEYTVPNATTAGPAINIQCNAAPGKLDVSDFASDTSRSTASPALVLAVTISTSSTETNVGLSGISTGATIDVSPHAIKDNGGAGMVTAATPTILTTAKNGNIARGSAINTFGNLAVNNTGDGQISNTRTHSDYGATTNGVTEIAASLQNFETASARQVTDTGQLAAA